MLGSAVVHRYFRMHLYVSDVFISLLGYILAFTRQIDALTRAALNEVPCPAPDLFDWLVEADNGQF